MIKCPVCLDNADVCFECMGYKPPLPSEDELLADALVEVCDD